MSAAEQVLVLGQAMDYGTCKAMIADGSRSCKVIINK